MGQGTCVPLCVGSAEDAFCEDPDRLWVFDSGAAIACWCLAACDPLLQDCVLPNETCTLGPQGQAFVCRPLWTGGVGQVHDECYGEITCDEGLYCVWQDASSECRGLQACCEPFCDLTAPDPDAPCSGVGQTCVPLFEQDPPPGHADVGVCSVPP